MGPKGGDREEDNLLLLCTTHHPMLDGDRISFFERIAATDAHPGGVAFVITATGELVEPDPRLSNAHPLPRDRRGGGGGGGRGDDPAPKASDVGRDTAPTGEAPTGETLNGETLNGETGPSEAVLREVVSDATEAAGAIVGATSCSHGRRRCRRDARSRDGPGRGGGDGGRSGGSCHRGELPFGDQVAEPVPAWSGAAPP